MQDEIWPLYSCHKYLMRQLLWVVSGAGAGMEARPPRRLVSGFGATCVHSLNPGRRRRRRPPGAVLCHWSRPVNQPLLTHTFFPQWLEREHANHCTVAKQWEKAPSRSGGEVLLLGAASRPARSLCLRPEFVPSIADFPAAFMLIDYLNTLQL